MDMGPLHTFSLVLTCQSGDMPLTLYRDSNFFNLNGKIYYTEYEFGRLIIWSPSYHLSTRIFFLDIIADNELAGAILTVIFEIEAHGRTDASSLACSCACVCL